MSDDCEFEAQTAEERRTLRIVLTLNAAMFLIEGSAGLWAGSSGLIADALDMGADASVYAISLFALSRGERWKARSAGIAGALLFALASFALFDVIRRALAGAEPESVLMIVFATLAGAVNYTSLRLLMRHRERGVHLRAAVIFTHADFLASVGVVIAGVLVHLSGSPWPDRVIGTLIVILVYRGSLEILRDAAKARRAIRSEHAP